MINSGVLLWSKEARLKARKIEKVDVIEDKCVNLSTYFIASIFNILKCIVVYFISKNHIYVI